MSGPEKQVEIEDVLSSIRRLVADGDSRESDVDAQAGASGGRLVLTPSLRVADELDRAQDQRGLADPLTLNQRSPRPHPMAGGEKSPHADADGSGPEEDSPMTLTSRIAALESAIAETVDQWEPDGSVGDDYAGTNVGTIDWTHEEGADDTDIETEDRERDAARSDEQPLLLDADDAAMDQDALRDVVADIVREELQGVLGERITRNLRKMIRREIHRALTARGLD